MLSRLSVISKGSIVQQTLKTCVGLCQRKFSVTSSNDNKYAWHKTAWPAWQMYKDKAGESAAPVITLGLAAYLISKEIYIINDEVLLLFVMGGTGYQLTKAVGPAVGKMLDQERAEILNTMNQGKLIRLKTLNLRLKQRKKVKQLLITEKNFSTSSK